MSMLKQEEINNIRSSVDIVDIIGSYLPLTQRGRNYFGVCPFHDDHSPSMSVSKEKQIYTCFSCGATGNIFNFIMDYEHIAFLDAVKIVADKAGIAVDIGTKTNDHYSSELYEIYEISSKFYQNNINTTNGKEAKDYLTKRDISDEVIKEFEIGLSLKERDGLTKILLNKKYDSKDLLKSGLSVKNETGYTDIYYNRIMFPLWDLNGKIVGYSGRIYNGEDTAKYINTKETDIFKKGDILYNYHRAKDAARSNQTIIVMEGFMDVIRAHIIGIDNVVATMGTAVTKTQANLLKRMAKNVVLCFDGDAAGAKATLACSNELLSLGISPNVVRLDEELDPDDYIKKYGKEQFVLKINNPMNIMDFKLSYLKNNKDFTNSVDVAKYVNEIIMELSKIDDEILREITLKKISEEAKLDINFLRSKLDYKEIKVETIKPIVEQKVSKYQKAERNLLFYMLKYQEVIKMYNKNITYMPTENYRTLARYISNFYKTYDYIGVADLLSFLDGHEELIKVVGEIEALNLKEMYNQDEIDDYINVIREYNINYVREKLKEKMHAELDPLKKAAIGQEMLDLKMGRDSND